MTINWSRAIACHPPSLQDRSMVLLPQNFYPLSQTWDEVSAFVKMIKKTAAQFCCFLPTSPPLWCSKHQGATPVFPALFPPRPRSRGTLHWSLGCWAALTAWVAQWETTDKRHEGRGRCYFWNYHGKRCNEKLTAGLERKKKEVAARKRKSSLGFFAEKL